MTAQEVFLFDARGIGHVNPEHTHQRGDACRTCTGCYHGHHDQCRHTIVCPGDGHVRSCLCCGLES
jgi:hypothetical protein